MKRITQLVTTAVLTGLMSSVAFAGALNGTQWQTIDDKTGEKKAIVTMTETNGLVSGTITSVNNPAHANKVCEKCSGSLKNKPIVGLPILTGLQDKGGNKWADGKLMDPESGKTYSGKAELSNDGQTLKLRGYVGSPIFGRNQVWKRVS